MIDFTIWIARGFNKVLIGQLSYIEDNKKFIVEDSEEKLKRRIKRFKGLQWQIYPIRYFFGYEDIAKEIEYVGNSKKYTDGLLVFVKKKLNLRGYSGKQILEILKDPFKMDVLLCSQK